MIEMSVPDLTEPPDRIAVDTSAQRHAAYRTLERGIGNALVRFAWGDMDGPTIRAAVLTTAARMATWAFDPYQGARIDYLLTDPGPGVRGDQ